MLDKLLARKVTKLDVESMNGHEDNNHHIRSIIGFPENKLSILVYRISYPGSNYDRNVNDKTWTEWVLAARLQDDGQYTFEGLQRGYWSESHWQYILNKTSENAFRIIHELAYRRVEWQCEYSIENGKLTAGLWERTRG